MGIAWNRVCENNLCKYRVDPVEGSLGITASPACGAKTKTHIRCKRRRVLRLPEEQYNGQQIVALDVLALRALKKTNLKTYDVIPSLECRQTDILRQFVVDYTARKIPWFVVQNGRGLALYIIKD